MVAPPIVTGANLYRSKLFMTAADVYALDSTSYLVAPAIPGKILQPVAVIARMTDYTGNYNPEGGSAYLVFGPTFDENSVAFASDFQQLFAGLQADGVFSLAGQGSISAGDFVGDPLYLASDGTGSFVTGAAVTGTVAYPGLLYAPGDQGELLPDNGESGTYTVGTVDGGGGVLTLTVSGGSGFEVGSTYSTSVTTGSGDGNMEVLITSITPSADFRLEIDVIYQPI